MDKLKELREVEIFNSFMRQTPVKGVDWRHHIIDVATKYFIELYPQEMEENRRRVGLMRETKYDPYASGKKSGSDIRALFNIPEHLDTLIASLLNYFLPDEPQFMEDKEDMWFVKSYPQFRIADKI